MAFLSKKINMGIRDTLKRSDAIVGLVRDFRRIATPITKGFARDRLVKDYLESNKIRKLQIGAGPNILAGWLSTDVFPEVPRVAFLDATRKFPFEDGTFDYIFSEHMIEHIPWADGFSMLKECRRVLKPGGTVRIATPDLQVIMGLSANTTDPMARKYIQWISEKFLPGVPDLKACFVINNAFRAWGHQFLYDGDMLDYTLRRAGLTNVRRSSPGESSDENLRGIDSHGKRVDDEMARFETMVFEGQCPA